MLLLLLLGAAVEAPACPIGRAVYRHVEDPRFTAGFVPQERRKRFASDLVLWVKTPKRTYFFSFQAPNGYGGTWIQPDTDPAVSARLSDDAEEAESDRRAAEEPLLIEFDAFDSKLKAVEGPPQSTTRAPSLLFARGLGPALWYNAVGLSGGDQKAEAESMPVGFFRAAGCARQVQLSHP